jgi:acetylornithine deacetylase
MLSPDRPMLRDGQSAIDSAIDRDRIAELAAEAVRIKSYSGDEAEIAACMADRMTDLGLEVQLQELSPKRFNSIGIWRGRESAPSFMYNGHMDTNPTGEGWTRDPLGGERDDDFVYGIGVCNMKSANASALHAVEALKKTGFIPQGDMILAFVVGELQGGMGTLKMIEQGIRAHYFVVGEPTELTLLTRHAASFVFEVWVSGKTRHLSKREEGIDAIAKLEALLPRLRDMKFSGAPSDETRALNRVHVGVIRGGMSKEFFEWRPQQLADTAMAKCAGRFGPGQTLDGAMHDLQTLLDEFSANDPEFRAELRLVTQDRIFMPPFAVDEQARPVSAFASAHREVTGTAPRIGAHTPARFFGSDAAHLAAAGMIGLLYGPGGQFNTMPDERVAIDEMVVAARCYARVIAELLGPEQ